MRDEPGKTRLWPKLLGFAGIGALGSGCDLQTKAWAEDRLASASMTVVDPWLEFDLAYNRGTAFSAVRDLGDARWVFGVFALVVVVLLAGMVVRSRPRWLEVLAMGAIAGGAIGNAVDRLFRLAPDGGTGVVDFVKINYPWGGSWPTFNVADVLVVVGGIALALLTLWRSEDDETADQPSRQPTQAAAPT